MQPSDSEKAAQREASAARHRREGSGSLGLALITVSDTRDLASDRSGALAIALLQAAGHRVLSRSLVPDEPARIEAAILAAIAAPACAGVILTGGTGISPRDGTPEVLARLWERELPGFGELFRWLSWQEVGAAAMLSRACAGQREGRLLVALPGSPAAVRLGLEDLLLPELGHLIGQLRKAEALKAEDRPLADEEPA